MLTNIQKIFSQKPDTLNIFDYTISDLVHMKIKSFLPDSSYYINTIPYVAQVITHDEILSCGAADLMELLRYVSGIDFGTDVIGQSGIIANGIWGHEGKVLLMIDGIPQNEFMYGSIVWGYHFPVDNIEKIEIIRGSGSVLYGSFAEIMIINIITKTGRDLQGLQLNSSIGLNQQKPLFYQNYSINLGKSWKNTLNISAFARISRGYRSTFNYTDIYGNSFNLLENQLNNTQANIKIKYKNLSFVAFYDDYKTTSRDYFITITSRAYPKNFTTYASILDYYKSIGNRAKIKINLLLKHDKPWVSPLLGSTIDTLYYSLIQSITTINPKAVLTFYLSPKIRLSLGSDIIYNRAFDNSPDPNLFWNGQTTVDNITYAQFSELYLSDNNTTISAGERLEYNPIYGYTLLPRLGISKKYSDNIVFKFTYDKSFRPPTVANISYNMPLYLNGKYPMIRPEITHYFNSQITFFYKYFSLSVTSYFINSKNAITYFLDKFGNEGYANVAHLSTVGYSFFLQYLRPRIYIKSMIDFQRATEFDTLRLYYTTPYDKTYLGISPWKYSLCFRTKITNHLTFKTNFLVFGPKKAYYQIDTATDKLEYKKLPSVFILTPGLSIDLKRLKINLNIYNLLNQKDYLVQPYKGQHAPLVNRGRVFYFSLKYKFNF